MRIFAPELEERGFRHGLLRDWLSAGLVDAQTAAKIADDIGPAPARTAFALRFVMFGFAAVCVAAAFFLFAKDLTGRAAWGAASLVAAVACAAGGEFLIAALKSYRHGAEEAFVTASVVLGAFSFERLSVHDSVYRESAGAFSFGLVVLACLAYLRYGYRLAFIGATVGLGCFIGSFEFGERTTRLLLAALYATVLAAITFYKGLPRRERERLELGRFFCALSVPLCLNLRLDRLLTPAYNPQNAFTDAYSWATFAAIFLIPVLWLAWGARERARSILWAGGVGLLVALCSVKPYLAAQRNSWDPAVLGVELVVVSVLLKRWLDSGPGRRRGAYSSEELRGAEPGGIFGLIAGFAAAGPANAPVGPDAPKGHGGDFGGGGASGSY